MTQAPAGAAAAGTAPAAPSRLRRWLRRPSGLQMLWLLVLALSVLVRYLRRRREQVPGVAVLSDAERARAEQLLKD